MFKNYFKTAIRSLWKNKTFSTLNILGLSIGIACAGLIFLWVEDEMGYDNFNIKKDRLYFARVNAILNNGVFTHGSTPGIMAPSMQREIPGIANSCRTTEDLRSSLFTIGDKSVYAGGRFTETSLFDMFTLPFVQGNPKAAFSQLYSLVITEKTARKFFGNEKNVIGNTVRMDNSQNYVISGVLKDLPENSSLQFEWLAPFEIWYKQSPWAWEWSNNCLSTYVELKPGVNVNDVNKKLYNYVQQKEPNSNGHVFLFGMNNWHLYNEFDNGKPTGGGQIEYVHLFSTIAWIILFIACINFMNLATARSEKRAREVGVRKVLGSGKKKLVIQFIGESLFLTFIAAVVAIVIMSLALTPFNTMVEKNLSLGLNQPSHICALLGIVFVCGLVAGSYPSLYLSSFNPVFVLKGIKLKTGSAAWIRKGLVITQFTISIVLIIGTIIIYQQIQHIKSRKLGFDKDRLIELRMQGDMKKNFSVIKEDFISGGIAEKVTLSDHATIYNGNNTDGLSWEPKAPGSKVLISWRNVSTDFFSTSGMKIMEGRDFNLSDTTNFDKQILTSNVIITESFAKLLGKGSAIGKRIYDEHDSALNATVVGVVNDYVYGNMYGRPDPVIFFCMDPRFSQVMYVRTKPMINPEQILSKMEAIMKKDNPSYPLEYQFVDEQFNQMFGSEMLISKLSRVFAALAILISCLGLSGLAAYTAERRTKEIGIRKVLGASVSSVTGLLSKDFLRLVLVSCLVAFPIAWWMMNHWLRNYQYRIEISGWIFLIAGLLAISIALITVSFQAIKAALTNPVKSLRTE